jgi:ornithine decarboxylase
MITRSRCSEETGRKHGTPLFVVDHDELRATTPVQEISAARAGLLRGQGQPRSGHRQDALRGRRELRRGLDAGVHDRPRNIKDLPAKERQDWIWDKIIYANPIKADETLQELNQYKPLVTFDNFEEIGRSRSTRRTPAWCCG